METKQKTIRFMAILLVLVGLMALPNTTRAGSLEPSDPPDSTMKTLDEVEPRIPIPESNTPAGIFYISQSGSYYLTGDRKASGIGIWVDVNDVTIDLMGYSLVGPGSGTTHGIYMNKRSNVEVRNGTVRNFGWNGIYEASSSNGKEHRLIGVRTVSNGQDGIRLEGYGHMAKDCTAVDNGRYGIFASYGGTVTGNSTYNNEGIGIYTGSGCTITGNTVYDNNDRGIDAGFACTVTGNTAKNNADNGIYAHGGSTVSGNTVSDNGDTGIYVEGIGIVTGNTSFGNKGDGDSTFGHGIYAGNGSTVTGNTVVSNFGDGVQVTLSCTIIGNTCVNNGYLGDGAGIHATNSRNRIEGNNVIDNDRGIDVDVSSNLILKNSASGNGIDYDIVAGNHYGQIITAPGAGFTSSNPWANFRF